jgi:NADPH:quinone reductase-like Zn-dependent oxidoreductase
MKAYALTTATEPAAFVDLPEPEAGSDGVRVRIHAAAVNGVDIGQANGFLTSFMEHRFPTVVGRDLAGVVDQVGSNRSDVAVGDRVFGFVPLMPPLHDGTFAERVASSTMVLAPIPEGVSMEVAAAIPLAGVAALDAVEAASVGVGDTVLIVGATGGVGSMAVQLAAQRGATVIATARNGDEEAFAKSLGAAETVDYSAGDLPAAVRARFPDGVTVLIDLVNRGDDAAPLAELVQAGGRVATTMGSADVEGLKARDVTGSNVMATPTPEKLRDLAAHVAAGTLRVEVQRTFPLIEIGSAFEAFGAGTRGKIVLTT